MTIHNLQNVAIFASPLYGYYSSVAEAFSSNGCKVSVRVHGKYSRFIKLPILGIMLERIFKFIDTQLHFRYLMANIEKYDMILLFGYYLFSPQHIARIRKTSNTHIVFWAFDSIHNRFKKDGYEIISSCPIILCYNQEDESELNELGYFARFTPLAYDENVYFPLKPLTYDIDIYFIGALKSRVEFLNTYIREMKDSKVKFQIDGKLGLWYIFKNKQRYPFFFKYYTGEKKTSKQINKLYNSSRICLNIQPQQATSGFSIRTYEINGAGGLQLCNGNKMLLNSLYQGNVDYIYYQSIEELVNCSKTILENYENYRPVRESAHRKSLLAHTYNVRVGEILTFVNELS